jgi:hypothetical protein
VIRETYDAMSAESDGAVIDDEIRRHAKRMLDGYELKPAWFG